MRSPRPVPVPGPGSRTIRPSSILRAVNSSTHRHSSASTSRGGRTAHAECFAQAAARSVFTIRRAIVIGPTPPGTGVSRPAAAVHLARADVAGEPGVGPVDADVDDRRPRLDVLGADEPGHPGGDHDDVGRPGDGREVRRVPVGDRDGRVPLQEQLGHGPNSPRASRPALAVVSPSTSLPTGIRSISAAESSPSGSGSCSRMPDTAGSAASSSMTAATSSVTRDRMSRAIFLPSIFVVMAVTSPSGVGTHLRWDPVGPGGTRWEPVGTGWKRCVGQAKTIVWLPSRITRSWLCHSTARDRTARSTSAPRRWRSAAFSACVTRTTSCSMIGPSSRSSVT